MYYKDEESCLNVVLGFLFLKKSKLMDPVWFVLTNYNALDSL